MYRAHWRLKACPRCNGDMFIDRAIEDAEVCIQCGFRKYRRVVHNTEPRNRLKKTATVVSGQADSKIKERILLKS